MKKTLFLHLFYLIAITSFSQEKIFDLSGAFSKKKYASKNSYAFANQNNKDLVLLTEEGKITTLLLLDPQYQEKTKLLTQSIASKYDQLIGYNIQDNTYNIFYSNKKNTKFAVLQSDFSNRTITEKILDFKLKKERYIETVTHNNQLYLFSITKRSSDFNIYTFDKDFSVSKHTISLKDLEYKSFVNSTYLLKAYDLITTADGISIIKIEPNNPNIIESTSKKVKLYPDKEGVILSFDNSDKETKLCYINLDRYTLDYKVYPKPAATEEGFKKSNSYIYDNKLFQIASSNQKMKFTVLDLETQKIIKEYKVSKKDSITFKNSPIIQEGGGVLPTFTKNRVREMEKTSKYLRKISSTQLGISVHMVDNEYTIILGGTQEINSGGAPMMMPGFGGGFGAGGTVGNLGAVTVNYNPTFYSYGNYFTTKSTYITCLFDQNFEHVQGDIPVNVFDKVKDFEDNLVKKPKAVNIFLYNKKIHFGFYDTVDNLYKLYKFD